MDLIVDAVAQLVSALRSVGLRPPVAIVLKSEDEVHTIETGAKEIWENLFARTSGERGSPAAADPDLGCTVSGRARTFRCSGRDP